MSRPHPVDRRGVAAVELAAVLLFFIAPLMIGVWEVGRLIQVQQIVSNSAREGARLAAQGYTINTSGSPTQIHASTGTPNVHDVVYQYLLGAGLSNLTSADVTVSVLKTDGTAFEPYTGVKGQAFTVTVTVPWSKVRWVNLGLVKPTDVTFTVAWQMLIDDAFTVNQTLPTI